MKNAKRSFDRTPREIRPVVIETGVNLFAEGSALIKAGNTHVLCTASVENKVPDWLAGKGRGWVTAEYSMLPRATHTRSARERMKISGRTQEIQRLIARALRSIVNLEKLGERMITVDCDVLQADGGTRTASITGGCVALVLALEKLHQEAKLKERAWTQLVSAVSVGMRNGEAFVDLDYSEDSTCDVDMNFVILESGNFVEIQGTAEARSFDKTDLDRMIELARQAAGKLNEYQARAIKDPPFQFNK